MLILSTFTSDYLQKPLQSLLKHFTSESVTIKYANKNLMGDLLNLDSTLEKSYAILFRIYDFMEVGSSITENKLTEHLNLLVNQITLLKHEKGLPFLVFLCPSPNSFYINAQLNGIEKLFIEKLNENKIHTLTLADVQEKYGIFKFENPIEDDTHIPYSPKFYVSIAYLLARKLHAIIQKSCKVIVVDCDNTLWKGAAVDEFAENIVFEEHNILLQEYLVAQQAKGVIICLCSRNFNEEIIFDVFKKHAKNMPLKFERETRGSKLKGHITAYKINEKFKSDNIKELALDLNLPPESFRFIDDNPIEIADVSQIPGILCITMPQNLEDYKNHWGFDIDEHAVVTETDKMRTDLYKQNEIKVALATRFRDPIEYLRSSELGQIISINKIESIDSVEDKKIIDRVIELSRRTNKFNSFPESKTKKIDEINAIIESDKGAIFVGIIEDNFSDAKDITAIAITSSNRTSLTINDFFVSCRVFRRGMEYEILKHIAQFSQENSLKNIEIKFKKSNKNKSAENFLNILNKEFKVNLDLESLKLGEEIVLIIPTQKIIEVDLDTLIRVSLNVPERNIEQIIEQHQNKQDQIHNNKTRENYLLKLNEMTVSYIFDKFFINEKAIQSIPKLENRITEICNSYLGEGGREQSLVARGLDSLKATKLRHYLYENEQINISIPKLLGEKTTVFSLSAYIKSQKKSSEKIPVKNANFYDKTLPVSLQQLRISIAEQQEQADNSANYHMVTCYKLSKNLEIQHFERACQKLIETYDVFGASFSYQNGKLIQLILPPEARHLSFKIKRLKKETSLEEAIQLEISKPWTMQSKDSLIRFVIFETTHNYHIFIHVHHAIFDAVSLKNCLDTLSKIYQHTAPNSSKFIDYPPQYFEFIYDQQKKLKDEAYQIAAYNFWKNTLSKIETVTTLPIDQPISTFKPATEQSAQRYTFSLSPEDVLSLKALAKSTGITCFSIINAVFGLLIASYTYQKNITLITATNGRWGHPSFDKMVGFFVNLLVQHINLEKNQIFADYLKQVNEKFLASQEFQDFPFNKIQEILSTQSIKDILLSPAFIYQNYAIPKFSINNEIAELEIPQQPIIFDLRKTCRFGHFTLFAQENDQELTFVIEYAEDLFSTSLIENFANNLLYTIRNVCKNPNQLLHDISVVSDAKAAQLISLGHGPKLDYAERDNLVKRFQQIVKKYPENDAICYGGVHFSYKKVDQQSTNLAYALMEKGVQKGNYVGIFLDVSHLFFIAELAALKIGAVFIPLSKEDPYDRLKSIIEDANIKFFIVDDANKGLFDTDFQACVKVSICSAINPCSATNLPLLTTTLEDSACILYTSGSTGMPKGVVLPQKAIYRVIVSLSYCVKPEDNVAQTANQVFDAAQLEFFLAFLNGARLVIMDKNVLLDAKLFTKELTYKNITVMWLTAGLFNLYGLKSPLIFEKVKYLMSGGDIVDKKAVEQVLDNNPNLKFMNGYGPTETGIFALTYQVDRENLKKFSAVPIGRPTIAGTEVVILNPFDGLAPQGAIGQLGILGDGLGRYHNNETLQKKCFLTFPVNQINNNSLPREILSTPIYMTGDKVQFKNNEICFLGRMNDEQIKIRGNLVSFIEIKYAVEKHSAIKQAEILYMEVNPKNKALVVFYTTNKDKDSLKLKKGQLIQFLSTKLSLTMIPTYYEEINKFPLTRNGKLDRAALSKSKLRLTLHEDSDSDCDKENISENLKKIQEELLSIFKVILPFVPNLDSNFFDTGGDSIQAIQLLAKIEEVFDKIISFNILRQNSSVRSLSRVLEENTCPKNDLLPLLYKGSDEKLPPIIFIHPAGGGLFCFNKLINELKKANLPNDCFGIEDPIIVDRQVKKLTIPEMATNYLNYIHEKINGRPFILAGYSFGGMVALEMAAQLEKFNQKSLSVMLLDTWVVSCAKEDLKTVLREHVLEYCTEIIQNVSANPKVERVESLIQPMMDQCIYYQEIGFKFAPKKLGSTCVKLFKAEDIHRFEAMEKETGSNYLERYIEKLEIIKVGGNHFNMLEESVNLFFLAKEIVEYVNNYITTTISSVKACQTFFPSIEQNTDFSEDQDRRLCTSLEVFSPRN